MLQDCRVLQFELSTPKRSLAGHVIKSFWVKSGASCEANCFDNDDCMSINFGPKTQGKHLCELSSSDHNLHPEDLKERPKFIYKSVLVSQNIYTVNVGFNKAKLNFGKLQSVLTKATPLGTGV